MGYRGNDLDALARRGFSKDKVEAFEVYLERPYGGLGCIQTDVQLLIEAIGTRALGDLDIDEFLRKLHEHLGAARKLFDFNEDVADEISDEVSKIVTKVSGSLVELQRSQGSDGERFQLRRYTNNFLAVSLSENCLKEVTSYNSALCTCFQTCRRYPRSMRAVFASPPWMTQKGF